MRGEFPFPLTNSAVESRYLTWIRHHSNYMALRGIRDYLRSVGVLIRGILINLLVVLPYFLAIALILGVLHLPMSEHPFIVTYTVGAVALLYILLFPLVTSLFNILQYKRTVEYGSDSSVKFRDIYERTFGYSLFFVAVAAMLESFPILLGQFHTLKDSEEFLWGGNLSLIGIVTLSTVADRVFSAVSGLKQKVLMTLFGFLGLLLPLIIILYVADYIVYGDSPDVRALYVLIFVPAISVVGVTIALILGLSKRVFAWNEIRGGIVALICSIGLLIAGIYVLSVTSEKKLWSPVSRADLIQVEAGKLKEGLLLDWNSPSNTSLFRPLVKIIKMHEINEDEVDRLNRELETLDQIYINLGEKSIQLDTAIKDNASNYQRLQDQVDALNADYYYRDLAYEKAYVDYYGKFTAAERDFFDELRELEAQDPPEKLISLRRSIKSGIPQGWIERLYTNLNSLFSIRQELDFTEFVSTRSVEQEFGILASLDSNRIERKLNAIGIQSKVLMVALAMFVIWAFCWLVVNINLTSIHGLYRDRLASTFLVGIDTKGDIDIEKDIDLEDICCYQAGSTAPYHLINVALNLQGSNDIDVLERKCGFFIFSKRFIGSKRTGYCRSELMEQVYPQMGLATAMAISAAAASPNMGRSTSPSLVALMTMLNIRLGFWIPNPGQLEQRKNRRRWRRRKISVTSKKNNPGFTFDEIFRQELEELKARWEQAYQINAERQLDHRSNSPQVGHGLVGIALSGGGIRSATLNMGIVQALYTQGVFRHLDYMSTVSGGGYLGSSISTLMRNKSPVESEIEGVVEITMNEVGQNVVKISGENSNNSCQYHFAKSAHLNVVSGEIVKAGQRLIKRPGAIVFSDIAGTVTLDTTPEGERVVVISGSENNAEYIYQFSRLDELTVRSGDTIKAGEPLNQSYNSFADRFRWRVRPIALLKEFLSKLDDTQGWVNLSDGGHIENLATIELLRRRCKYIIIGDGEADPDLQFGGFATLIRTARIDLGIEIEIDLSPISRGKDGHSRAHFAVGRIVYPEASEQGYLLYFKSSVSGDEDAVVNEYRSRHPDFPHQSTADQFFQEGQFEAYRALGQHIAQSALSAIPARTTKPQNPISAEPGVEVNPDQSLSFEEFERWFTSMENS